MLEFWNIISAISMTFWMCWITIGIVSVLPLAILQRKVNGTTLKDIAPTQGYITIMLSYSFLFLLGPIATIFLTLFYIISLKNPDNLIFNDKKYWID